MADPLLDDLQALLCFARVVELGSFTKAATALELSKSVVSVKVSALEQRLGEQLLLRTTRKVAMTELGARVYSSARAMLDAASAATLGASDVSRGHLRISAPVALTQLCLAPPVAQLLHEHPEAQIELLANDRIVDLVEERIDLAIRVTRLKDSSLIAKRLAFAPICICAAPRYLAAYGKPERPEDLLHHNCLRYALVATRDEWRLQTARSAIELAVHGSFAATSGLIMAGAAKAGIGLAILPRFMVADALRSGELVTLLDEFVPRPLGVYAVRSGRPQTPKLVARLIQLIAAALRVSGFPQTE